MSNLFEAPALNPTQRNIRALLLRFRRILNRSVANMLVSHERRATQYVLKTPRDRKLKDIGLRRMHIGIRTALFGLIVATTSLAPVVAKAEEVRDHRGGRAQQATRPHCDTRNHTHTSDGGCITARSPATVRDHRSR